MNITDILPLLTAFGLGSIVTALIQSWLTHKQRSKERNFDERKQSYVGLLEAYHKAAVTNSDEAGKEFAYWQMRCELVAPKEVRLAIENIVATNDNKPARYEAHEALKVALRKDLGIATS